MSLTCTGDLCGATIGTEAPYVTLTANGNGNGSGDRRRKHRPAEPDDAIAPPARAAPFVPGVDPVRMLA